MKLKRIEISGFKSFSNKEALHFEHPVTAIVGPNGSGKSNIREALSFVLGEQSIKSLRGKRSEDLIFNGSSKLPRLNRASVKIVFDNRSRNVPKTFDEIEIERTVHRDSSNHYFINSSPVRRKDIGELLSKAKIGPGSHHTISQGEADKALSLSPAERRALVEESLGLSYPQAQKREALGKLERTRENIREATLRKREHLPHLRYLKREMKAIEERRELAGKLTEKLRLFVPKKQAFFKEETERLDSEIKSTEEQLQAIELKFEKGEATHKQEEGDTTPIEEAIRGIREQKGEINRSLGRLEGALEALANERSDEHAPSLNDALSVLKRARETLKNALHQDNNDPSVLRNAAEDLLRSIDELYDDETSTENNDREASLASEVTELRERLGKLEKQERDAEKERENVLARRAEQRSFENEKAALEEQKLSIKQLKERLERQKIALSEEEKHFQQEITSWAFAVGSSSFLEKGETGNTEEEDVDMRTLEKDVRDLSVRVEAMSVGNTAEVEREYEKAETHHSFLEREIEDLERTSAKLEEVIESLTEKINTTFTQGLASINDHFDRFFKKMFEGGSARLIETEHKKQLPDGTMQTEKGIDVEVELGHKRLRSLSMLSGGERTLVSIALVFALTSTTPPPFLVLDETDAALDEANSKRYGDLVAELAEKSQLILITHNRETMARAGRLYGITMGRRACSELLSIDLAEAEDLAR